MAAEQHLWDIEHPCYHERGNYLHSPLQQPDLESHVTFSTWDEFYEFATGSDFRNPDLNLVYRWDWRVPDPEDYEEGEALESEKLMLYVMQQRRAFNLSFEIDVTRENEEAVIEWLAERAKTVRSIWAPILDKALEES